jgi:hypothetical protein
MAKLSITTAWNETAEFVRREAGLLFPISFMLLALPNALMELLMPAPPMPGRAPEAGLWLLLLPLLVVAAIIGNIAISYLAIRPGSSVGEALRRGGARMPALLAAAILIGIVFVVLFFIVALVAAMLVPGALTAAQSGSPTPAMMRAILIVMLVIVPIGIYFGARLMMMTPAAAAESAGPFDLMARSWALTAGHVWKLVGFLLLVAILVGVLTAAIEAVAGILFTLVAGPVEPGSTSTLLVVIVMALVNMVVAAYLTSLVARIYAQLSGAGTPEVFA